MDFLGWCWGIQERAGTGPNPLKRGETRGDKPADWITTVPFSLSLCLPKVGDYYLCEQGGWWESVSGVQPVRIKGRSCEATQIQL